MPTHAAVSLADIAAAGVRLRPTDAATIVRALVRQVENRTLPGVPSAHVVRLSPSGTVSVEGPVVATGVPVPRAAQLLADLLPRATRAGSDAGLGRVIDAALQTPPAFATLQEFSAALQPFVAHDVKAAVAEIAARWAAAAGITDGWDPTGEECDHTSVSDIRRARRETGISLDEVSRKSRIPVSLLRQLEWGYLRNWPKGMYGRTQLARYARAAGLERQIVLDAISPLIQDDAPAGPATSPGTDGDAIVIVQPTFTPDEVLFEAETSSVVGPAPATAETLVEPSREAAGAVTAASSEWSLGAPAGDAPAGEVRHRRSDDPLPDGAVPVAMLDPFARPEPPRRASLIGAAAVLALATAGGLWGMRAGPEDRGRAVTGVVRRVPATTDLSARRDGADTRTPAAPAATATELRRPHGATPMLRGIADEHVVAPVGTSYLEPADEDATSTSPAFASAGSVAFSEPVQAVGTSGDAGPELGLRLTKVVDDRGRNYHARPSPDGSLVAFDSDREGERGVYVADAGGKNLRRVSGDGFAALPSWSPDGRTISYVRAEPDNPNVWNLWALNLESGEARRLTANASGRPQGASWFPDSRRVAYALGNRIMVLDLTTGTPTEYASPQVGRKPGAPAVSPDGRFLIFSLSGDGAWLTDLSDGSSRKVLSDPTVTDFTWAPDGTRVAYYSRRDREWGVWIPITR